TPPLPLPAREGDPPIPTSRSCPIRVTSTSSSPRPTRSATPGGNKDDDPTQASNAWRFVGGPMKWWVALRGPHAHKLKESTPEVQGWQGVGTSWGVCLG